MNEPWMNDALCAETSPDLFFPEQGIASAEARKLCAGCPVAADCLEYAVVERIDFGVWGGKTATDRIAMRREDAS